MAITSLLFWLCFKHYNVIEDAMNDEAMLVEDEDDMQVPVTEIATVYEQRRKLSEGHIRYQLRDASIRSSTPAASEHEN